MMMTIREETKLKGRRKRRIGIDRSRKEGKEYGK